MRSKNYLWLLLFLWQACISPQDLEFDDTAIEISKHTEMGMPLLSGSLSLEDLLGAKHVPFLSLQQDGTYQFQYWIP